MLPTFSASTLQAVTSGHWVGQPPEQPVSLGTDTRLIGPGGAFIALSGERFDGHDYVSVAQTQQAACAIVARRWWEGLSPNVQATLTLPLLLVEEPLWAYMALAGWHRQQCPAKLIGLTGSSGKTTVKEGLYQLLNQLAPTQATLKNFNNDIGVSQTLLALQPSSQFLVCEMAMRGPGEIARLSRTARPDIALLLNVGPAHIGRLGSLEAIARAKSEIVEGLDPDTGLLIANGDDPLIRATVPTVWQGPTQWVSEADDATQVKLLPSGHYGFFWHGHALEAPQPGRHAVINSLLILAAAEQLGYSPDQVAQAFINSPRDPSGRWQEQPVPGYRNAIVVNDAYNANPASMSASLSGLSDWLQATGRQAVLVLGGMNELGEDSHRYHVALGQQVATLPAITTLIAVGRQEADWMAEAALKAGATCQVVRCEDAAAVTRHLAQSRCFPAEETVLLLKASRTYQLERIAHTLFTQETPAHAG